MSIEDKIPPSLIENFQKDRAAYFVGAGLSVGAGLPSWNSLMDELIELADQQPFIPKDKIEEYRNLSGDNNNFLFLAEDLKTELGKERFSSFMEEKFQDSTILPTKNHELIVQANCSIILTINYDALLERAYNNIYRDWPNSFIYSESKYAANNFWKGKFFILKAHGDAKRDVDSIILSQRDYRKVLYREPGYRSLLQAVFSQKSIVFVGVSMTDPEFNQLLDYLHDSYHGGGPTHYLLIDENNCGQVKAKRYLEEFKIEAIPYNNDNKDYKEVTEFLELVLREAPRR